MYTVEVYAKSNGNVLTAQSGFTSVEKAMDWGSRRAARYGKEAGYRVFPS